MGSILGSKQTSGQSQQSSGSGNSESVQGSTSTSTGQSSSFSRGGLDAASVLAQFDTRRKDTSGWSKENALADVQGVLRNQAYTALREVMPGLAKTERVAGAYNSTTRDLLANDAEAKITGELAQTGLNAITAYGQLGNQADATNNQLLSALSGVSSATGTSGSTSTQQSDSSSFGASTSEYEQNSSGSGGSKGGSGLLGLFADGGEVPEAGGQGMQSFLDASGLSRKFMDIQDLNAAGKKMMDGNWKESVKSFATNDLLFSADEQKDLQLLGNVADAAMNMFADGGQVPDSATPALPAMPDPVQAPALPQIVINVGNGAAPSAPSDSMPLPAEGAAEKAVESVADQAIAALLEDGGRVPDKASSQADQDLLTAIRHYKEGGAVRSGASDVKAGGKIRGKQSPTGEDNQVIGVAGGEGILPKDVMEVPGVPQLVQQLIQKYHTPINGAK